MLVQLQSSCCARRRIKQLAGWHLVQGVQSHPDALNLHMQQVLGPAGVLGRLTKPGTRRQTLLILLDCCCSACSAL